MLDYLENSYGDPTFLQQNRILQPIIHKKTLMLLLELLPVIFKKVNIAAQPWKFEGKKINYLISAYTLKFKSMYVSIKYIIINSWKTYIYK